MTHSPCTADGASKREFTPDQEWAEGYLEQLRRDQASELEKLHRRQQATHEDYVKRFQRAGLLPT